MRKFISIAIIFLVITPVLHAQETPANPGQNPPVQVTYLNVCTPSDGDKEEMAATLAHVPKQPKFVPDFEITHGLSSLENAGRARYVRLRREFPADAKLATVQYSISNDGKNTIETLVFIGRDPKELRQLSIEDSVAAGTATPAALIRADTPASRIKVERFGKSSLGLARCQDVDQSKYQYLFTQASTLMAGYRKALSLNTMLHSELRWLAGEGNAAAPAKKSTEHK